MKAVLLSVKPKYCELIANGKKTVEVRKSKPKIDLPFKCYIYCTKVKRIDDYLWTGNINNVGVFAKASNGKVIGEFVCDSINKYDMVYELQHTCLTIDELWEYGKGKILYGWHISDTVIYSEPKCLSEFKRAVECHRGIQKYDCEGCWDCEIKQPPQSWCYIEEVTHEV